ncbi:TPA: hypothetical protein ACNRLS_004417, partial [Escherichia coli]
FLRSHGCCFSVMISISSRYIHIWKTCSVVYRYSTKGWLAAKVKAYADNQIHKADVCKQVRREATVEFDEPDASP